MKQADKQFPVIISNIGTENFLWPKARLHLCSFLYAYREKKQPEVELVAFESGKSILCSLKHKPQFLALIFDQAIICLEQNRFRTNFYRNVIKFRSYTSRIPKKKFKMVVSKLLTHFCYPIRLVFHQHLNSHVAYPVIPPENSNHTRRQYQHLPSYPANAHMSKSLRGIPL